MIYPRGRKTRQISKYDKTSRVRTKLYSLGFRHLREIESRSEMKYKSISIAPSRSPKGTTS
jgi:hypothetical protein